MSQSAVKRAIIIAAGRGKRLMPYTDETPKCLVPVDHRTILELQLEAFRAHGVDDIVMIRGYQRDELTRFCRAIDDRIRFVDNTDWEHNNILESLFCADAELAGPVMLTYSDIVFTRAVVGSLAASSSDIALIIDRDFRDIYEGRTEHPLPEAEVADLDGAGRVRRVGKRALPPDEAWGEFIGLARLSAVGSTWFRDEWRALRERYRGREDQPFERAPTFRAAYLTDMLQHLIDLGRPIEPVGIHGSWREIDTVQDLERTRELLRSRKEDWS
jgi:choline kinase